MGRANAEVRRRTVPQPVAGHRCDDIFRVVAFDYDGHVMRQPKPKTLTLNTVSDRYLGTLSGLLATDVSSGRLKGMVNGAGQMVGIGIQGLVDGATRVVLQLFRLAGKPRGHSERECTSSPTEASADLIVRLALGRPTVRCCELETLDSESLPRQRSHF